MFHFRKENGSPLHFGARNILTVVWHQFLQWHGFVSHCCHHVVAHGRVVTSSGQITEVKQRRAQLVLGWVTGAQVTLPAMCRGGWASHSYHAASVHPAVMGTWWNKQWRIVNGNSCRKCAEFSTEEMRPYKREFQYQGCKL